MTTHATTLDCPCCGEVGAEAFVSGDHDARGYFIDGQSPVCGCKGAVSCDRETEPYISIDDCDCQDGIA